jgi:osmotically-inducible protein OsmY
MATPTIERTDEEIQHDVLAEMKWDARVQPNEIGVSVKNGVVKLTGWVDNCLKKWAAERAAHRVRGVKAVVNDIEVRLPRFAERTDADVAAAVTRVLEWDTGLNIDTLDVAVSKGWVTLRGSVEYEYQRREAERMARRITGVRGVTNLVTVRPRAQLNPEEFQRRIEEALVRNAETDAHNIQVRVDGDRVILRGTVRAWAEKKEAERIAWSAPGVSEVDNDIMVTV